jgi:periplasmic protein CpxP/Spy
MRRHVVLGFTIAFATALLATSPAWADGGYRCGKAGQAVGHHGHGHSGATGHLLKHLLRHQQDIGLNDDQIGKLRALALDADRAAIRASAERMVSERELRAMMWDKTSEMPAIEAKVKEAESHEAAVRIIGIRAKREMIAVLTPDQQAKFNGLRYGHRHRDGATHADAEPTPESDRHESDTPKSAS